MNLEIENVINFPVENESSKSVDHKDRLNCFMSAMINHCLKIQNKTRSYFFNNQ
jgi:uncharacterized protein YqiB (DUF1249 family)